MHILLLGGTTFLGRHLVAAAQARGHHITLLHRSSRDPFPQLENLIADRAAPLSILADRRFDAVIDTSGYTPDIVRASASLLAPRAARYCFISTISVYPDMTAPHDEDTPVAPFVGDDPTTLTPAAYGPLKALCEQEALSAFGPDRALILRPGLIVGAHDPSDRFTYWVARLARPDARVAAPGAPARGVQFVDALSLARFTVHALEQELGGVLNINGDPISMVDVLNFIRDVCASEAELVWMDDTFLAAQSIQPWMGPDSLPLWAPGLDASVGATATQRARAAGLTHRPLAEIVAETLDFARSRPADHTWRSGLSPAREAALLAAWDARP